MSRFYAVALFLVLFLASAHATGEEGDWDDWWDDLKPSVAACYETGGM